MKDWEENLKDCLKSVQDRISFRPEVALVLGSGLGSFGQQVAVEETLPYEEIEGFPVSTAPGHTGRFLFGRVAGVKTVVMQGRVHLYEGYTPQQVVLPIRLMGLLGAKTLLLTNAAGGLDLQMEPGDFMILRDQISCFVPSPLVGKNMEHLGVRFPDMSRIYDRELVAVIRQAAESLAIPVREGVYCQHSGPQYESPAEIQMLRTLGVSAVGMSTAIEAIAARHMGMKVAGISCISNLAAGMKDQTLSSEEVEETANRVSCQFAQLVSEAIRRIGQN